MEVSILHIAQEPVKKDSKKYYNFFVIVNKNDCYAICSIMCPLWTHAPRHSSLPCGSGNLLPQRTFALGAQDQCSPGLSRNFNHKYAPGCQVVLVCQLTWLLLTWQRSVCCFRQEPAFTEFLIKSGKLVRRSCSSYETRQLFHSYQVRWYFDPRNSENGSRGEIDFQDIPYRLPWKKKNHHEYAHCNFTNFRCGFLFGIFGGQWFYRN